MNEWTPEEIRRNTAAHEAGHAIMSMATGVSLKSASIVPDEDTLGRVMRASDRGPEPRTSLVLGADPASSNWGHREIMVLPSPLV